MSFQLVNPYVTGCSHRINTYWNFIPVKQCRIVVRKLMDKPIDDIINAKKIARPYCLLPPPPSPRKICNLRVGWRMWLVNKVAIAQQHILLNKQLPLLPHNCYSRCSVWIVPCNSGNRIQIHSVCAFINNSEIAVLNMYEFVFVKRWAITCISQYFIWSCHLNL